MRLRRLLPVTAAVTLAGFATFGCAEQSAGVRVGDDMVSESEMVYELNAYGNNELLFSETDSVRGELKGSYTQSFTAEIVQQRIVFMLSAQVFEDEGLELTDADRSDAEQSMAEQMAGGLDEFPDDYRRSFLDDVAKYNLLAAELGEEEFNQALIDKAGSIRIEVSSRFGEWNDTELTIDPPPGPTPGAGTETTVSGATG